MQQNYVLLVTNFTRIEVTPPVSTLFRSSTLETLNLEKIRREGALSISSFQNLRAETHRIIQTKLQKNRARAREVAFQDSLCNFSEGDFMPLARCDFYEGERILLC